MGGYSMRQSVNGKKMRLSAGRVAFLAINYIFLTLITFICIFPIINVLAISFSASWAAGGGLVKFWPVGFTLNSYKYVLTKKEFYNSFFISLKRLGLGVAINMLLTVLSAYPLSKNKQRFGARSFYSMFFLITIIFGGGLIPWYMTIQAVGILDTIWALVLPSAVPVFNVILLMNFFRQLPDEIEESALLDGAGYWTALFRIAIPLSLPCIATLILFTTVNHWNSWFDGLILMNNPKRYPMQSYLQTVVTGLDAKLWRGLTLADIQMLSEINDKTTKAAQVFLAALPIFCVYPFLQRYFMTGIVLGSVKG